MALVQFIKFAVNIYSKSLVIKIFTFYYRADYFFAGCASCIQVYIIQFRALYIHKIYFKKACACKKNFNCLDFLDKAV